MDIRHTYSQRHIYEEQLTLAFDKYEACVSKLAYLKKQPESKHMPWEHLKPLEYQVHLSLNLLKNRLSDFERRVDDWELEMVKGWILPHSESWK